MQSQLGATEFFAGAGTVTVTRKAKVIKMLEASTFTVLTMQFPATPAATDAVAGTTRTFPATTELRDVATFRLATGAIQVIYNV